MAKECSFDVVSEFDRHSHSDTKGNHYVEHRAKWYNPMTWFKHNE